MVNPKIKFFLKKKIKFVCDSEMESLKPGNVHKFAVGHDMTVNDFLKSGLIISKCLTKFLIMKKNTSIGWRRKVN